MLQGAQLKDSRFVGSHDFYDKDACAHYSLTELSKFEIVT